MPNKEVAEKSGLRNQLIIRIRLQLIPSSVLIGKSVALKFQNQKTEKLKYVTQNFIVIFVPVKFVVHDPDFGEIFFEDVHIQMSEHPLDGRIILFHLQ